MAGGAATVVMSSPRLLRRRHHKSSLRQHLMIQRYRGPSTAVDLRAWARRSILAQDDKRYTSCATAPFLSQTAASADSSTSRPSSICSLVATSGTRTRITLEYEPAVIVIRPCS